MRVLSSLVDEHTLVVNDSGQEQGENHRPRGEALRDLRDNASRLGLHGSRAMLNVDERLLEVGAIFHVVTLTMTKKASN